ncbi:hypothetical protein KUL106_02380 [Alteromonas sp. KUL106]|nr:hypothetical protein KUL106_02380 [Alteromonas sp. KUL106]
MRDSLKIRQKFDAAHYAHPQRIKIIIFLYATHHIMLYIKTGEDNAN